MLKRAAVMLLISLFGMASSADSPYPLTFMYLRKGPLGDMEVAVLRPIPSAEIGVVLDSGERKIKTGELLHCRATSKKHAALVEEKISDVRETVLECTSRTFVVKGILFAPDESTTLVK